MEYKTVPEHVVEVPKTFVITLTDDEAIQLTIDLMNVPKLNKTTAEILNFLKNRNA